MSNLNYKAVLHYLIVELDSVSEEKVSSGGIILQETKKDKDREQSGMMLATVLDVGECCWQGFDNGSIDRVSACKVGDKVVLARYAGQELPIFDEMPLGEQNYLKRVRLIKDDDVLAIAGGES